MGHGVTLKQVGWVMERPSSRWGVTWSDPQAGGGGGHGVILKQVGGSWSDPQAGGVGHGVTLKQVGCDME